MDLHCEGRDELVIATSTGLKVGHPNGVDGFYAWVPLLPGSHRDFRAVGFADVKLDGLPDVIAWIQGTVYVYLNTGHDFNHPLVASTDFPPSAGFGSAFSTSTLQVIDGNGDGCRN